MAVRQNVTRSAEILYTTLRRPASDASEKVIAPKIPHLRLVRAVKIGAVAVSTLASLLVAVVSAPPASALTNGWGTFRPVHSNICIETGGQLAGGQSSTWDCHQQYPQVWFIEPYTVGAIPVYRLRSRSTNLCLRQEANSAGQVYDLRFRTCTNLTDQMFKFVKLSSGQYKITQYASSTKCLDVTGSGYNGAVVGMYSCSDAGSGVLNANQRFYIDFQIPTYDALSYGDEFDNAPMPPDWEPRWPLWALQMVRGSAASFADANVLRNSSGGAANNATLSSPFERIANDCTQFVSTVWHLGGRLPENNAWYRQFSQATISSPLGATRPTTTSWNYVQNFRNYWLSTGLVQAINLTPSSSTADIAEPGDVLVADFTGDLVWDHVAVFTNWTQAAWTYFDPYYPAGVGRNYSPIAAGVLTDMIDQHNVDRKMAPWNIGFLSGNPANNGIKYQLLHWIGNTA
jgi:Putative amidase domain/Ricin-type beta-trefoil lectin domain-like